MSATAAYHLSGAAARLLLAGKGGGNVCGYLPEQPANRQQAVDLVAQLVRQGVVTNTNGRLRIEQPLDEWLCIVARAKRTVRLICSLAPQPDCCLYPGTQNITVLCMPRPGQGGRLRITGVPDEELWPLLCEDNLLLEMPELHEEPPDLPDLPAELLTVRDVPPPIPGLLIWMQLYRDGQAERAAFVIRREQTMTLAVTDPAGGPPACTAYCGAALQTLLNQWLKGEILP